VIKTLDSLMSVGVFLSVTVD